MDETNDDVLVGERVLDGSISVYFINSYVGRVFCLSDDPALLAFRMFGS